MFMHASSAGSGRETQNDRRKERGGYLLVFLTALFFLLVTSYLMNHSEVTSKRLSLQYFKEQVGQELSVDAAFAALRSGQFKPTAGQSGQLDLGYMREGVWVLMQFDNPTDAAISDFVLQLRHTYINGSLTKILGDPAAANASLGPTQTFTDKLLPKSQGLNDVRHVSFPVKVQPGQSYYALVRLKAHVMNVPFLLLEERVFLSSVIRELVPLASLFGGLLLLALYNVMVGLARRENEFLFYGVYVASIALMAASINGTGHMFLWPDILWLHYNSANLLINLVSLSYIAFSYTLFKETPLTRIERGVWMFFASLCGVGFVLQFVEGGFFASIQANLSALAALTLGLSRAWRARQKYGRIANLFIVSEAILFVGAGVYCIKMFGWLPSTSFTLNIVLLSATLEAILLSFVLSEKMRRTMSEKQDALENLEAAHAQLESSVRDKTLAMAARYTSHEVLNPVFAIRLKAERIRDEILLQQQSASPSFPKVSEPILLKVNDIFRLIDSIIQTIRAIKSMSAEGQNEDIVEVDLKTALDDALKMLEVKTQNFSGFVEVDFSRARYVQARRSDVVQVFANLISNSVDAVAGQEKPWIRVVSMPAQPDSSGENQAPVEISVTDSGTGPAADIRNKLFEVPVTTKGSVQGMGVGLGFCQRLVQRNAGRIGFDRESKATRFFFVLPGLAENAVVQADELPKAS
jgi:signal transduction histidine kinase